MRISGSVEAVDDDSVFVFGLRQSSFNAAQSHARRVRRSAEFQGAHALFQAAFAVVASSPR